MNDNKLTHEDIKKLFKNGKPIRQFTQDEVDQIEHNVQLNGEYDPDNTYLPNGKTVSEARTDYIESQKPKVEQITEPIIKSAPQPKFEQQNTSAKNDKTEPEVKPD